MLSTWERLTSDDDVLLSRVIVAIFDSSGTKLLGTGTFVTADGAVLTAHHVVRGHTAVIVRKQDGEMRAVEVRPELFVPETDIAVLRTSFAASAALPVVVPKGYAPSVFQTRGFQWSKRGFDDAVPLSGSVIGRRAIAESW